MKPGKKTWIWSIVAFIIIGLALSVAGYWWFSRGIAGTPASEASAEAAPTPGKVWRGSVSLGHDNDLVYGHYLGLRPDELEELRETGAI